VAVTVLVAAGVPPFPPTLSCSDNPDQQDQKQKPQDERRHHVQGQRQLKSQGKKHPKSHAEVDNHHNYPLKQETAMIAGGQGERGPASQILSPANLYFSYESHSVRRVTLRHPE